MDEIWQENTFHEALDTKVVKTEPKRNTGWYGNLKVCVNSAMPEVVCLCNNNNVSTFYSFITTSNVLLHDNLTSLKRNRRWRHHISRVFLVCGYLFRSDNLWTTTKYRPLYFCARHLHSGLCQLRGRSCL